MTVLASCANVEVLPSDYTMVILRWDPEEATLGEANNIAVNKCLHRRRVTRFVYIEEEPDGFRRAGFRCEQPSTEGGFRLPNAR